MQFLPEGSAQRLTSPGGGGQREQECQGGQGVGCCNQLKLWELGSMSVGKPRSPRALQFVLGTKGASEESELRG